MQKQVQLHIPKSGKTQFLKIAESLRSAIRRGQIRPGERISSTRDIASETGVHRQTVMAALDQLVAEGWIESEYRKGFRVSTSLPDTFLLSRSNKTTLSSSPRFRHWKDVRSVELVPFAPDVPCKFNFQAGLPDLRCFPIDEFRSYLTNSLRSRSAIKLLGYSTPQGHLPLIHEIKSYLRRIRGIDDRSIIITHGSQEAIFTLTQLLIQPGDGVAIEELCYPCARETFRFAGAHLFPLRLDSEGVDPDSLEQLASKHPLRLIYLTPLHQFPTTSTLSISRRHRIYEIASRHDILILEDDYDHEFHYRSQPPAPMATEDPDGRVLYVSTFSKVLFPSARIGFMAIPPGLESSVLQHKRLTSHQNDTLIQAALGKWISDGGLERHLRKMRRIYQERRDVLETELKGKFKELEWKTPTGGMGLWLDLKVDSQKVAKEARSQGLFISPESDYGLDSTPYSTHLRLGFSNHTPAELKEGISQLRKVLGTPKAS